MVVHADHPLFPGGQGLDHRGLDHRHQGHVAIRRHGDGAHVVLQVKVIGHIQRGGAVRRADDADGAGQLEHQVLVPRRLGQEHGNEHQGQQERGKNAELRRRAKEDHAGVLEQRREVDHRAHGNEDQDGEQLIGDARVEQHGQEAVFPQGGRIGQNAVFQHRRQVGQNAAKADGQQQGRFVFLLDGQIDQDARDDEHQQCFEPLRGEQIEHAGEQLA